MKLYLAQFTFSSSSGDAGTLIWNYDEKGKPMTVSIRVGEHTLEIENAKHQDKPCVTHAKSLIDDMSTSRGRRRLGKRRVKK